MSAGEAEQERRRLQQMVKGITNTKQPNSISLGNNDKAKKNTKPTPKRNKTKT
jgi:hypothetical protein